MFSAAFLALTVGAADAATLQQCAAIKEDAARLACYDALAREPAPRPSPAAPAPSPDTFGLPTQKTAEPEAIEAHVVGTLRTWKPGTVVKLDNGQVWKIVEEDDAYYPDIPENPAVTIRPRWLGSYMMEIKGTQRWLRVKRIS